MCRIVCYMVGILVVWQLWLIALSQPYSCGPPLERVAPEFTKQSRMPAAACPRESGGQHDVTPAQAGVQSTACPVTLVNATANCSSAAARVVHHRRDG